MPQDPFYSSKAWRDARETHLKRTPYCEVCAAIGLRVRANEVDHRKSIRSGGHPFSSANLCSLCKKHHSQKTILVDGKHKSSGNQLVITGPDGYPVGDVQGMYHGNREKDTRPKVTGPNSRRGPG